MGLVNHFPPYVAPIHPFLHPLITRSQTNTNLRERYGNTNPSISEITVSAIQTYYLTNTYLSKLTNTSIRTLDDIVAYNNANSGSEGGHPHDLAAFPDGQALFEQCVETKGIKTPEYHAALKHITSQCRENGIDAALKHTDVFTGRATDLDALLFCDVKRGGIQIAAQAGYPVLTLPVGLDPDGMPVSLVLIHSKWQDDKLVKRASAIEDLLSHVTNVNGKSVTGRDGRLPRRKRLGRIPPTFMNHLRKNVPVEPAYRYPVMKCEVVETGQARFAHLDVARGCEGEDDDVDDWERPKYLV